MIEDGQNEQGAETEIMLKLAMLQRLKFCFLKVLAKRQALEAELIEIKKLIENVDEKETKQLQRLEYLNEKIQSFRNQEKRLYRKIKWIEEKLKSG